MTHYRAAAPGITDRPVHGRETLAGVLVGDDRTIVVELDERKPSMPAYQNYAEVPFTIEGATRLRDALDQAIRLAGALRGHSSSSATPAMTPTPPFHAAGQLHTLLRPITASPPQVSQFPLNQRRWLRPTLPQNWSPTPSADRTRICEMPVTTCPTLTENAPAFFGTCGASACCYGCTEDVGVLPVVVAPLELGDIERQILGADIVERADDAALQQRPEAVDGLSVDQPAHILADLIVEIDRDALEPKP